MSSWSKSWKASKKPSKQRRYVVNAPLHIRNKLIASHLSKELRKKYNTRSVRIRKGDRVKVMRGSFKGKVGAVDRVGVRNSKVYITGIEFVKKDGSKALFPIHPSNLLVQELNTNDKRRLK